MSRYYQYKNGEEVFVRPDLERGVQYYMRSGYRANDVSATLTYSQAQRLGHCGSYCRQAQWPLLHRRRLWLRSVDGRDVCSAQRMYLHAAAVR